MSIKTIELPVLLVFISCHFNSLQGNNPFLDYLTKMKSPGQLEDVFEDPINKQYRFGLTPMFFGSKLMPLQREIYFKETTFQLFWQLVRTWIIKSSDIKKADYTYNNYFLPEAKNYYCEQWTCCTKEADCHIPGYIPKNGEILIDLLGDPLAEMPFRFLVIWCEMAWKIYYRDKANKWDTELVYRNIKAFCPNSCNSNPCVTKLAVENPNNCAVTGLFIDQFECECSAGSQWDKDSALCLATNPCKQSNYSACDLDGTEECVITGGLGFKCICKEHRMGFDCTQERNACLENFNAEEKSGNYYCNAKFSNKCIPYLGTNFYKCECTDLYSVDMSVKQDNCLKMVDSCEFLICMNGGMCTTSPDQTVSACLCPTDKRSFPMFTGFFCEVPIGVWSEWTSWSTCRPNCGESLYQLRKRICLNETLECEGFTEEIMPCVSEKPCKKLKLSGAKKKDVVDYPGLIIIVTMVCLQMVGSFFLAQFLILNRQVIFPIVIKYCCNPCHYQFKNK